MKLIYFGWLLLLKVTPVLCTICIAQINLSPTFLMIDDNIGIGELYIHNASDAPQEVSIRFQFGYPSSDETGRTIMIYDDHVREKKYSLGDQIRVFPQRFILEPLSTQTVILQVRPVFGNPDGIYFTRVVVRSNMISTDIDQKQAEGINTQINYVLNQNIPVLYRKGEVTTGLEITNVNTLVEANTLIVTKKLLPTGNAPFNGNVQAVLRNNMNEIVATQQQTVVAYFDLVRKISLQLPIEGLQNGEYFLELTYETMRRDVSPEFLVQAPAKTHLITLYID